MLGTYALSAGYYDAYYGKAQKVRTLIVRDFAAAYEQLRRAAVAHLADDRVRARRQDRRPAGHVPERRVHDPVEPGRAPGHDRARSAPATTGCPSACRSGARARRSDDVPGRRRARSEALSMTDTTVDGWELVVGLEVHAELATATKMFCGVPEPLRRRAQHQHLPGLPRPARLAAGAQPAGGRAGHPARAGRCTATSSPSIFPRKNYFYPDMPKDYQVSQYDQPINVDGWLELPDGHAHRHRAGPHRGGHRQVDPRRCGGGRIHGADYSLVDYNRAGVPAASRS